MSHLTVFTHYDVSDTDLFQLQSMATSLPDSLNIRYQVKGLDASTCDPQAQAISVFVSSQVTENIMDAMPDLRLVVCRSTGFNNIDLAAAKKRGIAVCSVPTYGVETVAEFAVALLLQLTRRLNYSAKPGDGLGPAALRGNDISGKTIGVIGTGAIGRHFIKLISAFGVRVLAYDIYPNQQAATELNFSYTTLPELLTRSHFISLHAPATPETHHLINAETLSQMTKGSYLINTARGELVDTEALIAALESGQLAGAGLDVFEHEGLVWRNLSDDPDYARAMEYYTKLHQLNQVVLTPHNAYNSLEAIGRINQEVTAIIEAYLGGQLRNQV